MKDLSNPSPLSAEEALEGLMYASYAFQRSNAPSIDGKSWRPIYPHQKMYEKKYQEDLKQEKLRCQFKNGKKKVKN